jgi:hypothetical protein
MATSLKYLSTNRFLDLVIAVVCVFCIGIAAAEQLSDPTRPAVVLVPGMGGSASATDANVEDRTPPQGLQSVIISPKHVAAIINGIEVGVGQKYADAVLTEVNETCVVLMGSQGRQVMHMFPTVNMTKNELACEKRPGVQPIREVASSNAKQKKAKNKSRANNAR